MYNKDILQDTYVQHASQISLCGVFIQSVYVTSKSAKLKKILGCRELLLYNGSLKSFP